MAANIGNVITFPVRRGAEIATGAVSRAASEVSAGSARLVAEHAGTVDDWGRDSRFTDHVKLASKLRWKVSVGGDQHLPRKGGALIVVNARQLALAPIFAAFAIGDAVDRPVRFVGRPDTAPIGAISRRIGGLLDDPAEVEGALAAGELVIIGAEHDPRLLEVGVIDHGLVGAAIHANVPVFPAGTSSSPTSRNARVEIGPASRASRRRRGPLAELELADHVRADIAEILEELGELSTGLPVDWLPFR